MGFLRILEKQYEYINSYKAGKRRVGAMWPFRFGMRRKRGLPHMIVYLLTGSAKNGVELMDGVESMTRGWWRPTPGSIYPLLKEMTDDGIVKRLEDGRYELTSKGRTQAGGFVGPRPRRERSTEEMLDLMQNFVSNMEDSNTSGKESMEPHADRLADLAKRLTDLRKGKRDEKEDA